jgi:hypothetical protein
MPEHADPPPPCNAPAFPERRHLTHFAAPSETMITIGPLIIIGEIRSKTRALADRRWPL